ncbi:toll/interleukin-1 receptor domain-containing protein [Nocardia salmonicida]|uniref:toll/interleukin-1 receptor domain-containing protein n=1 Tax=Nocardia salmonicida TaxID=53431 RepID=UPI0033EFA2EF
MSNEERRPTIFLSYAHADKARAQRIAAALEEAGYTVWWDALIEGGSRFATSIDEALDAADAAEELRGLGVRWVLVEEGHTLQGEVPEGRVVHDGEGLRLLDLGAPSA